MEKVFAKNSNRNEPGWVEDATRFFANCRLLATTERRNPRPDAIIRTRIKNTYDALDNDNDDKQLLHACDEQRIPTIGVYVPRPPTSVCQRPEPACAVCGAKRNIKMLLAHNRARRT